MARRELKLITRSGQWQKEIPCALRETWLPAPAARPPLAQMASLMELGGPWSSQLLPCPTSNNPAVLGFVGSSSDLPSVPQEAAGLPLPPPLAWR